MALKVGTLVKEVTTAGFSGTGPVQLAGTPAGEPWAVSAVNGVGDGNSAEWVVRGANGEWQRFIGAVTAGSPDTISRDIVIGNHLGTTAQVDFATGVKDVYLVGPLPMRGVLAKSADYTATLAELGRLIAVDASGAARTITLPPVASAGDDFLVGVKKTDSSVNTVTVDGNGAETLDGATTRVLRGQDECEWYRCDGTAWLVERSNVQRSVLPFVSTALIGAGSTVFLNTSDGFSSEADAQLDMPLAGVAFGLRALATPAPGAGQSITVTLRKSGADTAITATISGTNTAASDVANAVAFADGDEYAMKVVMSGGATPSRVRVSVGFRARP